MRRCRYVAPLLLVLALALPAFADGVVRFAYHDAKAATCAVIGDFNGWDGTKGEMARTGADFARSVRLTDGYHRYAFLVDGKTRVEDPAADEWDPGPKGTNNCLVFVGPRPSFARDFKAFPVVADLPPADRIVAVGDLHGALDEAKASLKAGGLIDETPQGVRWAGGTTTLVLTGDAIDRGDRSKEVLDLILDLTAQAEAAGGRVVALLGNHELWRITGYDGFADTKASFERAGLNFAEAVGPAGVYGRYFRTRPIAARVNGMLFCHGGLDASACRTGNWAARVEAAIRAGQWGCAELGRRSSLVWARYWWDDAVGVKRALKAWDCDLVVFGHTPDALGEEGRIVARDQRMVRIDIGMCPTYGHSKGGCLEIRREGRQFIFTALYPDRPPEVLFARPAARPKHPHPPLRDRGHGSERKAR